MMEEMTKQKKAIELTTKGKIIIAIILILIVGSLVAIFVTNKNNKTADIKGISLEMVSPNEGKTIDDPILGMFVELNVGNKIQLSETIHPKSIKNVKTEFIVEDPNIAEVNEDNRIVGKSKGTTKIYSQTKDKKIKSNVIEITVVE